MAKVLKLVFPTRRDTATFQGKGTTGQAQNLAKGWNWPGQSVKIQDRAEMEVLKQEKEILKQRRAI